MTWIIWIVAAPGVASQGCSPLGGGADQEHGELFCSELLVLREGKGITGMEREDLRPPSGLGLEQGAQAHLWPRWVCLARCDSVLRAGARKDEPAQHLGGCFLSLLLISDLGFNPSTIWHFLSSGDPAVFFIYCFSFYPWYFWPSPLFLAVTCGCFKCHWMGGDVYISPVTLSLNGSKLDFD